MGPHERFKLRIMTIAVIRDGARDTAVYLPEGAELIVTDQLSVSSNDANRQVSVEWDGKTMKMFAVDIQERGERMTPST
jgi:hypothetical protein